MTDASFSSRKLTVTQVCRDLHHELTNLGKSVRCPICMSTMRDAVLLSGCNHAYCQDCILQSLSMKPECPTCKGKATRRSCIAAPRLAQVARAYQRLLKHTGLAPLRYDPRVFMTQIPLQSSQNEEDITSDPALAREHVQLSRTFGDSLQAASARALWDELNSIVRSNQETLERASNNTGSYTKPTPTQEPTLTQLCEEAQAQHAADAALESSSDDDDDDRKLSDANKDDCKMPPRPKQVSFAVRARRVETDAAAPAAASRRENKSLVQVSVPETDVEPSVSGDSGALGSSILSPGAEAPKAGTEDAVERTVASPRPARNYESSPESSTDWSRLLAPVSQTKVAVEMEPLVAERSPREAPEPNRSRLKHDTRVNEMSQPIHYPKNKNGASDDTLPLEEPNDNREAHVAEDEEPLPNDVHDDEMKNRNMQDEIMPANDNDVDVDVDVDMNLAGESQFYPSETQQAQARAAWPVGTVVRVQARTWPGMNKLGGVGKVTCVHNQQNLAEPLAYDVQYVLGGRERHVDAVFVSPHDEDAYGRQDADERKASSRILHQEPTIPPDVLAELEADGFDVQPLRGASRIHQRRRQRSSDKKVKESFTSNEERPKKRLRVREAMGAAAARFACRDATAAVASALPTSVPEVQKLADAFYRIKWESAMRKKVVQVVPTGMPEHYMKLLKMMAKSRWDGVKIKIMDRLSPDKATLCVLPADPRAPTTAVGRTVKAMRSAIAGIPITSLDWIDQCVEKRKILGPTLFVRTLPAKGDAPVDNGVALTAAVRQSGREQLFSHLAIYLAGTFTPRQKEVDLMLLARESGATILSTPSALSSTLRSLGAYGSVRLLCNSSAPSIPPKLVSQLTSCKFDVSTVDVTWLFDSVSAGKVLGTASHKPAHAKAAQLWKETAQRE